jgi:hypothetical protein
MKITIIDSGYVGFPLSRQLVGGAGPIIASCNVMVSILARPGRTEKA